MFFRFDLKRMQCLVSMRLDESYKPNDETLKLNDKVNKLNKEMKKFMNEVVDPGVEEIQKLIAEQNKPYDNKADSKVEEKAILDVK